MRLEIPDFGALVLTGSSGSGISRFARARFSPDEIFELDFFLSMTGADGADPASRQAAFDCLLQAAEKRLNNRKPVVIDAADLSKGERRRLLDFARRNNAPLTLTALNRPEAPCRKFKGAGAFIAALKDEGFDRAYTLKSPAEADAAEIVRVPVPSDKRGLRGPFDIIGDPHGCFWELCALLQKLGWRVDPEDLSAVPPEGRMAVFLGDLGDRGPESIKVFRLAMNMEQSGHALCLPGNHEHKLLRYLEGKPIRIGKGIGETIAKLKEEPPEFIERLKNFLKKQVSHYVLDEGRLVCSHAGLPERLQGRESAGVWEFCLFGSLTGEFDEYGLPVSADWTADYRGKALTCFGHYPKSNIIFYNNTIDLDAACVFGGELAALRYPEREIVKVKAAKVYKETSRPIEPVRAPSCLNIQDALGSRIVKTGLIPKISVEEDSAEAALEIMGRFCLDPASLIYLPPETPSCGKPGSEGLSAAFKYYAKRGAGELVCAEKRGGARAVIIAARDPDAGRRFNLTEKKDGIIYTETGRPFFEGGRESIEEGLLKGLKNALSANGFWEKYKTGWLCIDCEILPRPLAARGSEQVPRSLDAPGGPDNLEEAILWLDKRGFSGPEDEEQAFNDLLAALKGEREREKALEDAWRRFFHTAHNISDIQITPLNIMASEDRVWSDVNHVLQLEIIREALSGWINLAPCRFISARPGDKASFKQAREFLEKTLSEGGAGMFIKPKDFISARGGRLIQPALECLGEEASRIIYGPDSGLKDHKRGGSEARRRALREFALGLEGLERFVSGEPLYRVHECVFGALALKSGGGALAP